MRYTSISGLVSGMVILHGEQDVKKSNAVTKVENAISLIQLYPSGNL